MKRGAIQWHSPEAEVALRFFLKHVALPDKRARYLDLISRPTSRRTFLETMCHELHRHLDPAQQIQKLFSKMLRQRGFCFSYYSDSLGEPVATLASVLESNDESFLVVSTDGGIGIHGPESYIKDREYFAVRR